MKLQDIHLRVGLLTVALGSLVWGFRLMLFDHAPVAFASPQEDMSFAWYVPLVSLYVLWTERKQLFESAGDPDARGLVATVPLLLLGFLGARGSQLRFEILSFAGLLVTIPWTFFGPRTARRMLFPAGYLLFCIPLATFLDVITVHLRILASSTAFIVLKGVGAEVIQRGTLIASPNFSIDVAEPCSGLRSLFALMALTAAYSYFTQKTWLRRAALFALSVPLAIIGNVMRIISICLVGNFASGDFATGFYHDYSGYIVFIVAIALMVGAGELIGRIRR